MIKNTTPTPRTDEAFPHLKGKTRQELQDKVEECSNCGNQDDYANAMSNLSDHYCKEKFQNLETELTEKTAENQKLRELLEYSIEWLEDFVPDTHLRKLRAKYEQLDQLTK